MKYQSGGAFRRALETRLLEQSVQTGAALARLRKMVAFDRFLARLVQDRPNNWVLKGGLALQLRLGDRARTTRDMDMLAFSQRQEVTEALRAAGALDLGDWFSFEVSEPTSSPAAGWGGIRHAVQSLLDGRTFEQFHVDVGLGDPVVDEIEYLATPDLLVFAGLQPVQVPCYPVTQQIAEKLHAYTRPRKSGESSRVKDFVDMLLLAGFEEIDGARLFDAIQATFDARNTHPIPVALPAPPAGWQGEFVAAARAVDQEELSLDQAYELLRAFLNPVMAGVSAGKWDQVNRIWKSG